MEEQTSVERWLSRLSFGTAEKDRQRLQNWIKWVRQSKTRFSQFTPDELITYQKESDNGTRYDILDEIVQPYILQKKGRRNTKHRYYTTIRSFFKHNRAELPKDPDFTTRSEIPRVEGTLTAEEVRNILLTCKPRHLAVYLAMLQGGMGLAEFDYWNRNGWEETKRQLDEKVVPLKIKLPSRKKQRNVRPYYTLIGTDAINALRNYVDNYRPTEMEEEAVIYSKLDNPIDTGSVYQLWLRRLRELGYSKGKTPKSEGGLFYRTGKSTHELRDVFRSLWEKSPAKGSIAEFFMGHQIDPLEYNKAYRDEKWARSQYLRAMPYLNLLSSDRAYGKVDEDEVERLRAEVARLKDGKDTEIQALRQDIEDLKRMFFEKLKEE